MILVGLGSNLSHSTHGSSHQVLEEALVALESEGVQIIRCSRWHLSEPVPHSDQPWFVNGVVTLITDLLPDQLLQRLHYVESCFGRVRNNQGEARILDLDLLAYDDAISDDDTLLLPHPRLSERAFVLLPLREVAPNWRHPISGFTVHELISNLPSMQVARPFHSFD